MSNFLDNIVNKRFRLVFDFLRENGKIKSKSDIAAQLGTYNHIINSILKGKRNITLDQMNKLIETYHINANFMFGYSNQMFDEDDNMNFSMSDNNTEYAKNITLVPHLAMAGNAIDIANLQNEKELPKFYIPTIPGLDGNLIAIEISGDSMLPNITNGDLVICERVEGGAIDGNGLKDNSVYIVVTDTVVAKRVQKVKENNKIIRLRLISDNTIYPPYEVELAEVKQVFRVKYRLTQYGIA